MANKSAKDKMVYRRLGRSGLQVSVFSFGSWVSFDNQMKDDAAMECMQTAYDAGCNFFDNAEAYAAGESEAIMGRVIAELGWRRHTYVLSSKFFWGIERGVPNMVNTLNRKYLMQAVEGSLERLGVDFLDLIYCHRADPNTPIEETVWAMSDIVSSGKALYWGTSEWQADEIRAAWEIAERHHLHKPIVEQPQYNLLDRKRVEEDYSRLYTEIGLGTTIFSPLASGLLTGKYKDGIPADSRGALAGYEWLNSQLSDGDALAKVERLRPIAAEFDCTLAQLCLAWCAANPNVSSVITGASRVSQVAENFGAIDVLPLLTPEVMATIAKAVA
jgi:voltage-dependent potassium channel beta subunit